MKQLRTLLALVAIALLAACGGETDNSEPPAPLTSIDDPIPLDVTWKLDTRAAANTASFRLRPLLAGERIYTIDTAGTVSSVDPESGRRQWLFDTGVAASAGLGGNAEVLLATSRNGDVAAYRVLEDGLESLWRIGIDGEIRAAPVIYGDRVFVRSVDGRLRSLALADGSQVWMVSRRVPPLSLTGTSEPLVTEAAVYAGFDDGKLLALDRDNGEILWEATVSLPSGRTEVERLVDLDGRFMLRDGILYVSSFQGRLAAVQAVSGDILWTREFSSFQPLGIDDRAVYLSADNSHLWAIDRRTGTAFWKQDVLNARHITAPALVGDDRLVVADLAGYLHWFERDDGRLVGRIRAADSRIYVQPLIWRDQVLTLDKFGLLASYTAPQ
ncbi:MAG: outer membrane protein assembly factor BamB [Gammaproteobacteria bacterium]|nr:outer membrane protein assembly factor BamB [Gammaproteobacteria bacterium]